MTGYAVRPTRIVSQGMEPHVSVRATSTEQSVKARPVQRSVTSSAAVQHGVTSPSPAVSNANEDVGQRHVRGQRSLLRSSDNMPAGTTSFYPSKDVSSGGGRMIEPAPPTQEESQGAGERVTLNAHLDVRVTRGEHDAIKRRATVLGVKPSTWARAVLRDALDARSHEEEALAAQAAVPRPSPERARAVEQVRRVGVNLNQVMRSGTAVSDELLREVLAALADVRVLFGDEVSL